MWGHHEQAPRCAHSAWHVNVLKLCCTGRSSIPAQLRCSSMLQRQGRQRQWQPAAPVAAAREHLASPIGNKGSRYAVVVSRFNELVTRALLAGALETFTRYGVPERNLEVRRYVTRHSSQASARLAMDIVH